MKLALSTLVKQCCGILIDHYATSGQIAVHDQIREFKEFISSPSHYAKLMTTAEYQLKEKRQRQNRRPATAITSTVSFVQARKVALAHVTRHVGVRLASLFSDWKDRHSWIDRSQLSKSDKELLRRYSEAASRQDAKPCWRCWQTAPYESELVCPCRTISYSPTQTHRLMVLLDTTISDIKMMWLSVGAH